MSNSELYNKIAEMVSREIRKFTPQLFSVKDHTNPRLPPKSDASSILLTDNKNHFLVTAGHVVKDFDLQNIGIMLGNDFCTIGGDLGYLEPNDESNYEPSNYDIAIFKLDTISVNTFKEKYDFLTFDKLEFKHYSSLASRYLIFGYPGKLTQKNAPTKRIMPASLILRTVGLPPTYYFNEGIDPSKSLILVVNQENIGSSDIPALVKLQDLGGISGCGVWSISNLHVESPEFKLVSILTGENDTKTVLYSTKVDFLLKWISHT